MLGSVRCSRKAFSADVEDGVEVSRAWPERSKSPVPVWSSRRKRIQFSIFPRIPSQISASGIQGRKKVTGLYRAGNTNVFFPRASALAIKGTRQIRVILHPKP